MTEALREVRGMLKMQCSESLMPDQYNDGQVSKLRIC